MSVSLRLPVDLNLRLSHLAEQTGRCTRPSICSNASDLEDLYLAEQRLLDFRAGCWMIHSLDDAERSHGRAGQASRQTFLAFLRERGAVLDGPRSVGEL